MTKNEELKHAEDIFDALTESYLMHYGTPGMHWRQQGPGKRWQSQAVYAQGRLNPDARVKGQNEVNAAKKRMAIQNETLPGVPSDLLRKRYPSQKLSDLNRLDGKPTFETRREINHPSNEKGNEAGRHYNCPNCATAFEMQERGYDVIARPAKNGSNVGDIESNFENGKLRSVSGQIDLSKLSDLYKNMQNTEKRYKNTSFNNVKKRIDNAIEARKAFDDYYTELNNRRSEAADNAIRSIQSQGKNARGIVVVGWAQYENPSRRTSLYHAFNYKNENGELKFYDTQSNHGGAIKGYSADDAKKAIFPDIDPREIYVMRTDGINVTENVTNSVYSPTRKNNVLQHAESVFDALTESYLMHYGTSGMHWYRNGEGKRWQSQAVYAQGRTNPNAKTTDKKEVNADPTSPKNPNAKSHRNARIASDAVSLAVSLLMFNPAYAALSAKSIADAVLADQRTKKNEERLAKLEVDPESGLRLKSETSTEREDMKMINPGFRNYDDDTKNNCMNCTTAYELRRRGFDVAANKRDVGYTAKKIQEYFPGAKHNVIQPRETDYKSNLKASYGMNKALGKKILSELSQQPDGSRGNLMIDWPYGGGHSVVYEVNGGQVTIRDCQINKSRNTDRRILNDLLNYTVGASYIRTDNAKVDYDKIKEAVH